MDLIQLHKRNKAKIKKKDSKVVRSNPHKSMHRKNKRINIKLTFYMITISRIIQPLCNSTLLILFPSPKMLLKIHTCLR